MDTSKITEVNKPYFKMKRLLALLLIIPFVSSSQNEMDIDTLKFNFSEVVQADTMNAKTLYSNAKLFIANAFVSAKDVTQLVDDNSNTLVVKGLFILPLKDLPYGFSYMKDFTTTFKLQIQAKDNKYKYTLSDLVVKGNPVYDGFDLSLPYQKQKGEIGQKQHKKLWDTMKTSAYNFVTLFIKNLKNEMVIKSDF